VSNSPDPPPRVAEGDLAFACPLCRQSFAKAASWVLMVEEVHCPHCATPLPVDRDALAQRLGVQLEPPSCVYSRRRAPVS